MGFKKGYTWVNCTFLDDVNKVVGALERTKFQLLLDESGVDQSGNDI